MSAKKKTIPDIIPQEEAREIKRLLEDLTHSGSQVLGQNLVLTSFKWADKGSDYVDVVFKVLKGYLKKEQAQVRYSTVQLYNAFFLRYETFREKVLERLDKFFTYALGIKRPLPLPDNVAKDLVCLSIEIFEKWHSVFGSNNLKLKNAYRILKDVHNVDFAERQFIDPKLKREKEENQMKLLKINKERLNNFSRQIEELRPEIDASLTSIHSCFELLQPSDDFISSHSAKVSNKNENLRQHGIINPREFKIEIQLDAKLKVVENEENGPILEAVRDSYKIINNSFLPKVTAWIELINIAEGGQEMLNVACKLKERLNSAIAQYNRMEVVRTLDDTIQQFDEVSSDSDLEEVQEPQTERKLTKNIEIGFLSERLELSKGKPPLESTNCSSTEGKPNNSDSSCKENGKSMNRKAQLLEVAPKLPYDVDLYHWEDEKLPTPTLIPVNTEGGRFWGASISEDIEEIAVPGGSGSLRSRVIEFTGKFEPVTRACRAPLPSGKLCPRHDRIKCPLHGIIIDRNAEGKIVNPEDEEKVKKTNKKDVPDWQDPKLLAELKAATGLDLRIPAKGERMKGKKKHPGLIDVNKKSDSSESRLAKKVFNRQAVKRVAATLDKLDQKRFRDKFGDQFNYVHHTS